MEKKEKKEGKVKRGFMTVNVDHYGDVDREFFEEDLDASPDNPFLKWVAERVGSLADKKDFEISVKLAEALTDELQKDPDNRLDWDTALDIADEIDEKFPFEDIRDYVCIILAKELQENNNLLRQWRDDWTPIEHEFEDEKRQAWKDLMLRNCDRGLMNDGEVFGQGRLDEFKKTYAKNHPKSKLPKSKEEWWRLFCEDDIDDCVNEYYEMVDDLSNKDEHMKDSNLTTWDDDCSDTFEESYDWVIEALDPDDYWYVSEVWVE